MHCFSSFLGRCATANLIVQLKQSDLVDCRSAWIPTENDGMTKTKHSHASLLGRSVCVDFTFGPAVPYFSYSSARTVRGLLPTSSCLVKERLQKVKRGAASFCCSLRPSPVTAPGMPGDNGKFVRYLLLFIVMPLGIGGKHARSARRCQSSPTNVACVCAGGGGRRQSKPESVPAVIGYVSSGQAEYSTLYATGSREVGETVTSAACPICTVQHAAQGAFAPCGQRHPQVPSRAGVSTSSPAQGLISSSSKMCATLGFSGII